MSLSREDYARDSGELEVLVGYLAAKPVAAFGDERTD
jgi:hypothetical protein